MISFLLGLRNILIFNVKKKKEIIYSRLYNRTRDLEKRNVSRYSTSAVYIVT